MDKQRIADELEIRELVTRYCDAIVRRDAKAWGSTWADDGVWEMMGEVIEGREAVVEKWLALTGGLEFVHQVPSGTLIEFDGDGARGRCYVTEYCIINKGSTLLNLGVDHDDYVRVDGAWKFGRRRFGPLYIGPPDLSANPMPFPADAS